ncbi:MAG: pilus assembly protein TadG-related protein [Chloroflexota bacterium]|nr:pilus assembly protein TadG-related protein [Chloroflexota bacterium]
MNKGFKFFKKLEDGQVLVLVALMLFGLIGFAALLTDGAMMQLSKRELQAAADAAALAGASYLPGDPTKAETTARGYVTGNGFEETNIKEINTPYENDKKIEVVLEQPAMFTFGRIFNPSDSTISARAVAMRYPKWAGEALPFINLDDNYDDDPEIELWEKVSPGDFESIWKDDFDIFNEDDCSLTYFTVDYMDGVQITKGEVADKKQEVECVFGQGHNPVFVISLRTEVIESGEVKLKDGSIRPLDKMKNKDIINEDQLVLLECDWYFYEKKTLRLHVNNVYDFVNGEFPENYYNPDGGMSNLVE